LDATRAKCTNRDARTGTSMVEAYADWVKSEDVTITDFQQNRVVCRLDKSSLRKSIKVS